jgi:hypothetical protein
MALSDRLQRRLVLLLAAGSLACATAPREGDSVHVSEESAIIIWDTGSKTQHFIRRATFDTAAKDFGFLVPTPAVPSFGEASDTAFSRLEWLTRPPRSEREMVASLNLARRAESAKVEVVAKVRVAGYDAAVLKASDAGALDVWLKANGYHSSPELRDWYKPYIAKAWIITAFKVAQEASGQRAKSAAVRMSFQAEQPYFPYREPAAANNAGDRGRALTVYFLGDFRPEGRIGASTAWPGRALWSGRVPTVDREQLMKDVNLEQKTAPAAYRLTRFEDSSSPRPGSDDLFFSPAADQSDLRVEPPHVWRYDLWLLLPALLLLALIVWAVRLARRLKSP